MPPTWTSVSQHWTWWDWTKISNIVFHGTDPDFQRHVREKPRVWLSWLSFAMYPSFWSSHESMFRVSYSLRNDVIICPGFRMPTPLESSMRSWSGIWTQQPSTLTQRRRPVYIHIEQRGEARQGIQGMWRTKDSITLISLGGHIKAVIRLIYGWTCQRSYLF